MKEKRLGRGLEEISQVFLSSHRGPDRSEEDVRAETGLPTQENPLVRNIPTLALMGPAGMPWAIFALTNLAIELARQGRRTLVVDDDPGGLTVTGLMGQTDLESPAELIFATAAMGVKLAYRTAVLNDLLSRNPAPPEKGRSLWPEAYRQFDFILYHLRRGHAQQTTTLLERTTLCVAMAAADAESLLHAYEGLKHLHLRHRHIELGLTVITDKDEESASWAFKKMAGNVKRFLDRPLISYAYLKTEPEIEASIQERLPLVLKSPSSPVRRDLMNLSSLIIDDHRSDRGHHGMDDGG